MIPLTLLLFAALTGGGTPPEAQPLEPARATPPLKPASARPIVVLDAPSNLGLRPSAPGKLPGVYQLPQSLRRNRIVERLGARDAGAVPVPAYSPDPDLAVGFRNGSSLSAFTRTLADRMEPLFRQGDLVVLLGGDCSVLLGGALALRRLGTYGLATIDAHDDYSYIRDRKRYEGIFTAAGLDIALVTGHGPAALSDLEGRSPYFQEAHVVQLGLSREPGDSVGYATEIFDHSAIRVFDADRIRRDGARKVGEEARRHLEALPIQGFFVHVDADVLDASIMPAVDSPNPKGLRFEELTALLAEMLKSPRVVGVELAILDPDLDPDGVYAARFTDAVVAAFPAAPEAGAAKSHP